MRRLRHEALPAPRGAKLDLGAHPVVPVVLRPRSLQLPLPQPPAEQPAEPGEVAGAQHAPWVGGSLAEAVVVPGRDAPGGNQPQTRRRSARRSARRSGEIVGPRGAPERGVVLLHVPPHEHILHQVWREEQVVLHHHHRLHRTESAHRTRESAPAAEPSCGGPGCEQPGLPRRASACQTRGPAPTCTPSPPPRPAAAGPCAPGSSCPQAPTRRAARASAAARRFSPPDAHCAIAPPRPPTPRGRPAQ